MRKLKTNGSIVAIIVLILAIVGLFLYTKIDSFSMASSNPKGLSEVSLSKYINYNEEWGKGTLLQYKVKTGLTFDGEETAAIKNSKVTVKTPQINGEYPENLTVVCKSTASTNGNTNRLIDYSYDKQSGLVSINVSNEDSNGNPFSSEYNQDARDEFEIISNYSENTYTGENEEKEINLQIATSQNLYAKENNKVENSNEYKVTVSENVGDLISVEQSNDDIYNGLIKSNIINGTTYDTLYKEYDELQIGNKEAQSSIEVKETTDAIYKSTTINNIDLINMLGENGTVEILDADGNTITTLDKDNTTIVYETAPESIIIKTSKILNEGLLRIENTKQVKSNITDAIRNTRQIIGKKEETETYAKNDEKVIEIKNSDTKVDLTLNNSEWTNERQNEVTFDVTLNSNNIQYNLFKNPTIRIQLPSEVEKVIFGESALLYGNGLELQGVTVEENENGKVIVVNVAGTQTEYTENELGIATTIKIPATIILKQDIETTDKDINVGYTNSFTTDGSVENGNITKKITVKNYRENEIITAITEAEKNKVFADANTNTTNENKVESNVENEEPAETYNENIKLEVAPQKGGVVLHNDDAVYEGEYIKYNIKVTNNTDQDLENLRIVANIPDGVTCAELHADFETPYGDYDYELKRDTKEKVFGIAKLEVGKSIDGFYEVKVNDLENDEEKEFITEVSVYNGTTRVQKNTIKNIIKPSSAQVFMQAFNDYESYNYGIFVKADENKEVTAKVHLPSDFKLVRIYEQEGGFGDQIITDDEGNETVDFADGTIVYSNMEGDDETSITNDINAQISEDNVVTLNLKTNYFYEFRGNFMRLEKTDESSQVELSSYVEVIDNEKTYMSNITRYTVTYDNVKVSMSSDKEGEELNYGDEIEYIIKIDNISGNHAQSIDEENFLSINVSDFLPENVEPIDVQYYTWNIIEETENNEEVEDNALIQKLEKSESITEEISALATDEEGNKLPNVSLDLVIPNNESITLKVKATAGLVEEKTQIENNATVSGDSIDTKVSNTIVNTILAPRDADADYYDQSEYVPREESDDNGQNNNQGNNQGNNNQGNQEQENNKRISGIVWLDQNEDGQRQTAESTLSNIEVLLINIQNGNQIQAKTNTGSDGSYNFENLNDGNYIVVFKYDTEKYRLTDYQKASVSTASNSDVTDKVIAIDGSQSNVGLTDTINLTGSVNNIDMGLVEKKLCDLKVEKTVSKIMVKTKSGTKQYDYNNQNMAKVEIRAKEMQGAIVTVEYKIVVTNIGEVTARIGQLVDKLPDGLNFSSELNSTWIKDLNGQITNTSLANKTLRAGESTELTIITTKAMTENSTGLFTNTIELQGVTSVENTKDLDENNNSSKADVIISVSTGSVIFMTIFIITLILLVIATIIILNRKQKINLKNLEMLKGIIPLLVVTIIGITLFKVPEALATVVNTTGYKYQYNVLPDETPYYTQVTGVTGYPKITFKFRGGKIFDTNGLKFAKYILETNTFLKEYDKNNGSYTYNNSSGKDYNVLDFKDTERNEWKDFPYLSDILKSAFNSSRFKNYSGITCTFTNPRIFSPGINKDENNPYRWFFWYALFVDTKGHGIFELYPDKVEKKYNSHDNSKKSTQWINDHGGEANLYPEKFTHTGDPLVRNRNNSGKHVTDSYTLSLTNDQYNKLSDINKKVWTFRKNKSFSGIYRCQDKGGSGVDGWYRLYKMRVKLLDAKTTYSDGKLSIKKEQEDKEVEKTRINAETVKFGPFKFSGTNVDSFDIKEIKVPNGTSDKNMNLNNVKIIDQKVENNHYEFYIEIPTKELDGARSIKSITITAKHKTKETRLERYKVRAFYRYYQDGWTTTHQDLAGSQSFTDGSSYTAIELYGEDDVDLSQDLTWSITGDSGLLIIKQDADDENIKLQGVQLRIVPSDATDKEDEKYLYTTDSYGEIYVKDADTSKNYEIYEVSNPNYGYIVKPDNNLGKAFGSVFPKSGIARTVIVPNIKDTGNIKINKVDYETGEPLEGVEFKIKNQDGNYVRILNDAGNNTSMGEDWTKVEETTDESNSNDNEPLQENANDELSIIEDNDYVQYTSKIYIKNMDFTNDANLATVFKTDDKGIVEIYGILTGTYTIEETNVGETNEQYEVDGEYIYWYGPNDDLNGEGTKGTSIEVTVERQKSYKTVQDSKIVVDNEKVIEDGVYEIQSKLKNKNDEQMVLDVYRNHPFDGTNIELYHRNAQLSQKFYAKYLGNGKYKFIHLGSGKTIDVQRGGKERVNVKTNIILWTEQDGDKAQEWTLERKGDSEYYKFIPYAKSTGKDENNKSEGSAGDKLCMDAQGRSTSDTTNVFLWPSRDTDDDNQLWKFYDITNWKSGTPDMVTVLAKNKKKDFVKISGRVWEEDNLSKDNTFNPEFEETDTRVEGIKVSLIHEDANGNQVQIGDSVYTNSNGEYIFNKVDKNLVDDKLYVSFEYDGVIYTTIQSGKELNKENAENVSKVEEVLERRQIVDANYSKVSEKTKMNTTESGSTSQSAISGDSGNFDLNYKSYPTDKGASSKTNNIERFESQYDATTDIHIRDVYHFEGYENYEQNKITATTKDVYNLSDKINETTNEITNVNCGLGVRGKPNFRITTDLYTVSADINGYTHDYYYDLLSKYAQNANNGGDYEEQFKLDVFNYNIQGSKTNVNYVRNVYPSDLKYIEEHQNDSQCGIYLTYRIRITNKSNALLGKVYKVVNYHDARYTIVAAATNMDLLNSSDNKDITISKGETENSFTKEYLQYNNATMLDPANGSTEIFVKYKLNNDAALSILSGNKTFYNVVEIDEYTSYYSDSTYYHNDTRKAGDIYAGIDSNSAPGNAIVRNTNTDNSGDPKPGIETFEDDTMLAPAITMQLSTNERTISGNVFEDNPTEESRNNNERIGDGIFNDGENTVGGVKVELIEFDPSITSYENGNNITINGNEKIATIRTKTDETDERGYVIVNSAEASTTTDENGSYSIRGIVPGQYLIKYTYGDGTTIYSSNGTKDLNADYYKSTIISQNSGLVGKFTNEISMWYKDVKDRYSSALDDKASVERITQNDEVTINRAVQETKGLAKSAYTAPMNVKFEKVENDTDNTTHSYSALITNGDNSQQYETVSEYKDDNICFGIIERPRTDYEITKKPNVEFKMGQQPMPVVKQEFLSNGLPGFFRSAYTNLQIEDSLLNGGYLDITYVVTAKNISEKDYNTADYYNFGNKNNAESNQKTLTISKVIDYLDGYNLNNNELSSDTGISSVTDINDLKNYLKDSVIEKAKGKNIILLKSTKQLQAGEEETWTYTATPATSTTSKLEYDNYVECIEIKTAGISAMKNILGDFVPSTDPEPDEDPKRTIDEIYEPQTDYYYAEIDITSPTGGNRNIIILAISTVSLVILAGGVWIIKKKVL